MSNTMLDIMDWMTAIENNLAVAGLCASSNDEENSQPYDDIEDALINSAMAGEAPDLTTQAMDDYVMNIAMGHSYESIFRKKLDETLEKMPEEKRKKFEEPDFLIEIMEGIFEQYHGAFALKLAAGESRRNAGERSLTNSGFEAGAVIVNEITSEAKERLHDTLAFNVPPEEINKRIMTILGVTIACTLSALNGMNPDYESFIIPQIMKIDPQVKLMPKEQCTPEHILKLIDEAPAKSWESWQERVKGKSPDDLVRGDRGPTEILF